MRAQRRRFVVEVKRGTNRASFVSTDPAAEKFTSAEDALFGPKAKPVPVVQAAAEASAEPKGRILRDLHEPPPPPLPELPPPARRGRKPGSKNKPKPILAAPPPQAALGKEPIRAEALAWDVRSSLAEPLPSGDRSPVEPAPASGETTSAANRRPRLRDRSTILKRYVHGTEPAPGQTGWMARRRILRRG